MCVLHLYKTMYDRYTRPIYIYILYIYYSNGVYDAILQLRVQWTRSKVIIILYSSVATRVTPGHARNQRNISEVFTVISGDGVAVFCVLKTVTYLRLRRIPGKPHLRTELCITTYDYNNIIINR